MFACDRTDRPPVISVIDVACVTRAPAVFSFDYIAATIVVLSFADRLRIT